MLIYTVATQPHGARGRGHPLSQPSTTPLPRPAGEGIGAIAARALLAELETYPKPGLVSPVDPGSHDDMNADTFRRSVAAISPIFARLAEAGAGGADLSTLRAIGLEAEAAMLAATKGINTHRGAIFALGLLCAAAGTRARDPAAHVSKHWGAALLAEMPTDSHGARAMATHGVGGARGEAAAGFPTAVHVGLPTLRAGRRLVIPSFTAGERSRDQDASIEQAARVQTFFALLATCDDTNLLHRGGKDGLAFAHREAAGFLSAGGIAQRDWLARAVAVHRAFVARRLSPGGSADLLAVTLFLDDWERR